MIFYIGIITAAVSGLLRIRSLHDVVKRRYPAITDHLIDVCGFVLLLTGLFLTIVNYYANSFTITSLRLEQQKQQQALIDEKTSIKSLNGAISIKLSAEWKDGKLPDLTHMLRFGGGGSAFSITYELENGDILKTEFEGIDALHIDPISGTVITIQFKATAAPGSDIFGKKPSDIAAVREIGFTLAGFNSTQVVSQQIKLYEVDVQFFANGEKSFEWHSDPREETIDISKTPELQSPWLVWVGRKTVVRGQ